ncbi:hypothetical protein DRE_05239 [Drechslerella stenobrocha 248]|uniref:Vacuolar protein-sorting-associated protein 24 n=1 Tax=Drechslerella stenobrocha 248 TaxID=1043628 RepID=W7I0E1_9PEZI|nr:hypothetical protein DRE_05239 [Drechslerella stenobrocha 248]
MSAARVALGGVGSEQPSRSDSPTHPTLDVTNPSSCDPRPHHPANGFTHRRTGSTPLPTAEASPSPADHHHSIHASIHQPDQTEPPARSAVASPTVTHATMETIKGLFWKPDPAEQLRKCNSLIRTNARALDRQIYTLKTLETKTKTQIKTASTRPQRAGMPPSSLEIRLLARELVRIRRQHARLTTSKAQLESVGMQVREAFAVRKIQGSMKTSTQVMRDVNALVRLPELTGTMQELSQVLIAAKVMEEMAEDAMPMSLEGELEEEEGEEEVDKVISELVGERFGEGVAVPEDLPTPAGQEPATAVDDQVDLQEMRSRLEQLRS